MLGGEKGARSISEIPVSSSEVPAVNLVVSNSVCQKVTHILRKLL